MGLTHRHPDPSQIRSLGNKPGQIKAGVTQTSAFSFEMALNDQKIPPRQYWIATGKIPAPELSGRVRPE